MRKRLTALLVISLIAVFSLSLAGCSNLLGGLLNVEGDEYETDQLKPKDQVKTALGDNYEIVVNYGASNVENGASTEGSYTTQSTTKVSGGYTFTRIREIGNEESTPQIYLYGNGMNYTYDNTSGKYTTATAATETYYGGYKEVMEFVGDSIDYNEKDENASYINRACVKYTRTASVSVLGTTVGGTYVYYIDKDTGICLKYEMTGGVSSQTEGNSSSTITYSVESLKIGGVSVTDQIEKIAVIEWPDEDLFTSFGLENVAKPTGTYKGGNVTLGDGGIVIGMETVIEVADVEAAEAICQSLFDAGAKINADEQVVEFADLFESDTSYLSFNARTTLNGYKVIASGYLNNGMFQLSIEFVN